MKKWKKKRKHDKTTIVTIYAYFFFLCVFAYSFVPPRNTTFAWDYKIRLAHAASVTQQFENVIPFYLQRIVHPVSVRPKVMSMWTSTEIAREPPTAILDGMRLTSDAVFPYRPDGCVSFTTSQVYTVNMYMRT